MTVQEMFEHEKIDQEFIQTKMIDGSPYWESCEKFLGQCWERDEGTMSIKQQQWLAKILESCVEKRLENT